MKRKAIFSKCGKYRYFLERDWGTDKTNAVLFICLNPSIADDKRDDPTIRRCINFAKDWGYERLQIANIFAYVHTNPKVLSKVMRSLPVNYDWIKLMIKDANKVVVAWGANPLVEIPKELENLLKAKGAMCLGKNKNGSPKHPLYIKRNAVLEVY